MAEADQSSQKDHHPRLAETKSWGLQAILGGGRSGHLTEGGSIGGGLRVGGFGATQTAVGGFTHGPEGIPVPRTDAAPDVEILAISDNGLGTQRPSLLKELLEPRRLVVTALRGIDSPRQHMGTELAGSTARDPTMKDQPDLIRSAQVEVIPNHTLKPHATGRGSVKHAGVGDLELTESRFVNVNWQPPILHTRRLPADGPGANRSRLSN